MTERLTALASVCLALALTACGGSSDAPSATNTAPTISEKIDIGGRSLYLNCKGSGGTTVVFEAGLTGDHRTWEQVVPDISKTSRTCTYDRANIGQSDAADTPRSAAQMVDDLHALLAKSKQDGPFVMVGFSFGGLVTQLYASTYPKDVSALVLVESNYAQEVDQFQALMTPAQITADREFMASNPEKADLAKSFEETKAAGKLPDVPLVVITSDEPLEDWGPGMDPDIFNKLRAEQQKSLTTLVSDGTQLIASGGHELPADDPATIIKAIEQVLSKLGK